MDPLPCLVEHKEKVYFSLLLPDGKVQLVKAISRPAYIPSLLERVRAQKARDADDGYRLLQWGDAVEEFLREIGKWDDLITFMAERIEQGVVSQCGKTHQKWWGISHGLH